MATGIPAGTSANITVSGPNGFSQSLAGSQLLSDLAPGSYTVISASVTSGGQLYFAAPAAQTVVVSAAPTPALASVSYSLAVAALDLTVTGVPAGSSPSISVSGPGGYSMTLSGSQTLSGITPGVYSISAASFSSGGYSYAPTPAAQSSTVAAGAIAAATVSYAPTTGALSLAVSGLPGGVAASITVSGPAGYSQSVTATQLLGGLAPGNYTVSAATTSSGGTSYTATPAVQSAGVSAGATAALAVGYSASGGGGGGGGGSLLDLRIDGAYLTQATQRYDGSVPLVAGRDAYLRVFALANQATGVQPQVRVRLYNGGSLQQTYTLSAPAGAVPTGADQSSLSNSWNVLVPASLVQPGLQLLADVDPGNSIAESDESNNQFPLSGSPGSVDVRALPTFAIRFVPVLQQVNGLQGDISSANQESFLGDLKKLLPVGAYDADVRAPYTTTAPVLQSGDGNAAWNTILSELLALRTVDASSRYYYGVVKAGYSSGIAGLAYIGGSARTAIGWDFLPSATNIMAHEVGHNLGRMHAPCGGAAGTDPAYPYSGAQIGVWGMDVPGLLLKPPTLTDVMSYCAPNWISDYNWSAMVSYRQSGPNNAPPSAGAGAGLLVWGRITPAGVVLEPAFEVPASGAAPQPGPNRLELLDASGGTLQSVAFGSAEVADLPGGREEHFAFVVPLGSAAQQSLSGLRVVAGGRSAARASAAPAGADPAVLLSRPAAGQVELRWDGARFPMALVRDAATGQILSFARGGAAHLWASGRVFQLQFSDGVRSVSLPARTLR